MDFKKKCLLTRYTMNMEDLNHYYRMYRKYLYDNNIPLKSSAAKKKIYSLTSLLLKIDRKMVGRELNIYGDKRGDYKNIDRGKIYAASHVGRYDAESCMEAINEQVYAVMGDPGKTYRTLIDFDGFFLEHMLGRVCTDTGYQELDNMKKLKNGEKIPEKDYELIKEIKEDRHICEETCIKRLDAHDNILIYPEGAWNITPKLTQPLFTGTARMAIRSNALIVPIGVIRDGKKYSVNIGEPMDVSGASLSDVQDITDELKEKINTLKGEMIFDIRNRIEERIIMGTPEENLRAFIDDIMSETTNDYTEDVIEGSRFFDKNAPENVYKTLEKVKNKTLY